MTQMSTQVFFITSQAKDTLVIPASAVNFKPRKPGETADKKWSDNQKPNWQDRRQKPEQGVSATEGEKNKLSNSSQKENAGKKDGNPGEIKSAEANADDGRRKPWPRRGPPAAGAEAKPQPAVVQVIDAKGNLTERNVVIGIGNRVQVQVLEGLQEGEVVVSGIRQPEKTNVSGSPVGQSGAPGAPGGAGGARQMR